MLTELDLKELKKTTSSEHERFGARPADSHKLIPLTEQLQVSSGHETLNNFCSRSSVIKCSGLTVSLQTDQPVCSGTETCKLRNLPVAERKPVN
jgi:hypothetical protein